MVKMIKNWNPILTKINKEIFSDLSLLIAELIVFA